MLISFIAGIKILIKKEKINWVTVIALITTFILTFMHKRHMVFFVICATSMMYVDYMTLLKPFKDNKYLIYAKNAVIICFISFMTFVSVRQLPSNGNLPPLYYPVGSIEFIKINQLSGNLWVPYGWGSYALWKLYPQNLVSVDGRYEIVYPKDVFNNVMNYFDYYSADILLISKKMATRQMLTSIEGWKPVYEDPISYVLVTSNKVRNNYILPNPRKIMRWREDLSKPVDL